MSVLVEVAAMAARHPIAHWHNSEGASEDGEAEGGEP